MSAEPPEHPAGPAADQQVAGGVNAVDTPPPEQRHRQTLSLDAIADGAYWDSYADDIDAFKQGDMVASVPLSWIAPPGIDPLTGIDSHEADAGPVVAENNGPAIICSQTCDLGTSAPGNKHPLMLLAPVIQESAITSKAQLKLAADGRLDYLIPVLPPDASTRARLGIDTDPGPASAHAACGKGDRWFADLRMLMPASKALLIGVSPMPGFVTEDEQLRFAEYIAQKVRRPALDERLSEALPKLLRQYVSGIGKNKQAVVKVEQVRLHITDGSRLMPSRAQLFVLTDGLELTEDEQDQWAPLNRALGEEFAQAGLTYAPLIHVDVQRMTAATYRETVPVRCDLLGAPRW